MKCAKCQSENPDGAKFCIGCGRSFEQPCPQCGAMTPARGKFCMECGHELNGPTKKSTVQALQPKSDTPKFLAELYANQDHKDLALENR